LSVIAGAHLPSLSNGATLDGARIGGQQLLAANVGLAKRVSRREKKHGFQQRESEVQPTQGPQAAEFCSGFGKDVVAEPSGSGILDGRKKRQGGVFSASPRLNDDFDRRLAPFRSLIARTMLNGRSFGVR